MGEAMRPASRSVRLTAGLVVASFLLAACRMTASPPLATPPSAATPSTSSTTVLHHFDGEVLSFDYPGTWREATFDMVSSFSSLLVYLSTAPMADPCDRTPGMVACVRSAVSGLEPDGVLVEWSRRAWPGWTFDPAKGRSTVVGGRRATLEQLDASEVCAAIGGVSELVVTIDDPVPDQNWTEMRACLRGPSLDGLTAQIEAMLATVTWNE
jgi:hypothetical protein